MTCDSDSNPWVLLETEAGRQKLKEAEECGTSQFRQLHRHFHKQMGYCYCGYASAACVLSALGVTDETVRDCDLLSDSQLSCCVYDSKQVEGRGIPLEILRGIVNHYGANTMTYCMTEYKPELLRKQAMNTCSCRCHKGPRKAMILNYWVPRLKMCCIESGHHSIAAAYHQQSDMILVLDPSQFMNHAWYQVDAMCSAMNTIDRSSNDYRGFLICRK